ncbi:MAG: PspC domain-containing protein [Actinomycetota bacterium]|nr:PspC domain-containing protein [Actinomycetota bacterium]
MSEINAEHPVRDFWTTRPSRRTDDRKVAGVAAAIGRRYAIDPVLVRVAFVVATLFSGVGVLLYLLGWLLLPVEGDQASAAESVFGRGRSSMPTALTVVLVLLLIPATGAVFSGRAEGVLGLAVALGGLVLLHRSRGSLGEVPIPPITAAAGAAPGTASGTETRAEAGDDPDFHDGRSPTATTNQPVPPAWDPLGAAPFAWDLPEPSAPPAEPTPPRGPRSKITPVTLGLALLTGGIASAFFPALSAAQIAALLLGVVGLGLVVGSLVRGGRGLILIAVPLALLTWVLQAAPVTGFKTGEGRWNPVTVAQVQPRYELTMGQGQLDLTGLRLADGQTVTTSVTVGFGETHVILPSNVDAQVSCHAQFGDVDCLGLTDAGHSAQVNVPNNGTDGPGGGTLKLDVRAGFGHVHVERGS